MGRSIDLWINANAITLLATAVTTVFAWEWHRANQRIRPARVPDYVVVGTVAFTCIWVAACVGAWWLRRAMDRIVAMGE